MLTLWVLEANRKCLSGSQILWEAPVMLACLRLLAVGSPELTTYWHQCPAPCPQHRVYAGGGGGAAVKPQEAVKRSLALVNY